MKIILWQEDDVAGLGCLAVLAFIGITAALSYMGVIGSEVDEYGRPEVDEYGRNYQVYDKLGLEREFANQLENNTSNRFTRKYPGPGSPDQAIPSGKLLIVDATRGRPHEAWLNAGSILAPENALFQPGRIASSEAELAVLVQVGRYDWNVGTYSGAAGVPAIQWHYEIHVVDVAKGITVRSVELIGGEPPTSRSSMESNEGTKPDLAGWLTSNL